MERRILTYRKYMDELLAGKGEIDWERIREQHLIQVGFFQHERLIHLIVTVTFAIMEIIALLLFTLSCNLPDGGSTVPATGVLCLVVFVLLVPYVRHYWILENEVQKMYRQYDEVCIRCGYKSLYQDLNNTK